MATDSPGPRVDGAVVQNVRLASPIRGFTRHLMESHTVAGVPLPTTFRVALPYGAANVDEREFADPERFVMDRPNTVQFGWGQGPHTCVGTHLSQLEMQPLLRAMAPRVAALEIGMPERLPNHALQGISRLPARFVAA